MNFDFIRADDIWLHRLGEEAEKLCLFDPDAAFTKLRKFGEHLARIVANDAGVDVSMAKYIEVLQELARRQVLAQPQLRGLHKLRKLGNLAAHPDHDGDSEEAVRRLPSEDEAIELLRVAHELAQWFHTWKNGSQPVAVFCPPSAPRKVVPIEAASVVEPPPERRLAPRKFRPGPDMVERAPLLLAVETGSPDEQVDQLCRESIATARALHEETSTIERAWEAGRIRMEGARAPFRLGVVGEFRSGKSTLINGLLGVDVAPRGATETTCWISRYGRGLGDEARLIFQDGRVERLTHEEANHRILGGAARPRLARDARSGGVRFAQQPGAALRPVGRTRTRRA